MTSDNRLLRIKELHQSRSKSLFLRFSLGFAILSLAWAWSAGTLHESVVSKEQRGINLERFIGKIIPDPTRESGQWIDSLPWITNLIDRRARTKSYRHYVRTCNSSNYNIRILCFTSLAFIRKKPWDSKTARNYSG